MDTEAFGLSAQLNHRLIVLCRCPTMGSGSFGVGAGRIDQRPHDKIQQLFDIDGVGHGSPYSAAASVVLTWPNPRVVCSSATKVTGTPIGPSLLLVDSASPSTKTSGISYCIDHPSP